MNINIVVTAILVIICSLVDAVIAVYKTGKRVFLLFLLLLTVCAGIGTCLEQEVRTRRREKERNEDERE